MLVERWLDMTDPRRRTYGMKTRGHLITPEKLNLFDIQPQFCEQVDTMLAELDNLVSSLVNATGYQELGLRGYQDLIGGFQDPNISRT